MKAMPFVQAQVRDIILNHESAQRYCQIPNHSSDLKSMLDSNGRREEAGGNPLHTDMNAIAPMG
jgi:hypothetical protein